MARAYSVSQEFSRCQLRSKNLDEYYMEFNKSRDEVRASSGDISYHIRCEEDEETTRVARDFDISWRASKRV